jgi:hypothetical protein
MAVAFVIRGLKEFGEPTRKALIMNGRDRRLCGLSAAYGI